jgi:hypothetical protein
MNCVDSEGDSFVSNIFPQENGKPVVSGTGEYWVKLNFMGKKVKVKVDDHLPVDVLTGDLMVPLTEKGEIWPALYVKAICKLFGVGKFYQPSGVISEGKENNDLMQSLIAQYQSSKVGHENPLEMIQSGQFNLHSSLFLNKNINMTELNTLFGNDNKENAKEMTNFEKQDVNELQNKINLLQYVQRKKQKKNHVFHLKDLIANIDVIYTVTGYVPLTLNNKNWDSTFYSKFTEALSEENIYENNLKIFGIRQSKVLVK